jgi:MFS family permease
VFWLAAVPAAVAMLVLVIGVKEGAERTRVAAQRANAPVSHSAASGAAASSGAGAPPEHQDGAQLSDQHHHSAAPSAARLREPLGRRFWAFLAVVLIFTLGNSTDAFLLLRAHQLGVSAALIPILWAMLHVVKSASSVPGGALSDAVGRKPLIVAGWLLYAAAYYAFGRADATWHAWALFAVYGLFFGLTEGAEKALVADLVPAARRGTAFGWYNLAIGLGALPASLIFGAIWDRRGPSAAFTFGATLALVAALGIALVAPAARRGRRSVPNADAAREGDRQQQREPGRS